MTPDRPGWYWYKTPDVGWQVVRVYERAGVLMTHRIIGSDIGVARLKGSWGPRVEEPQEVANG